MTISTFRIFFKKKSVFGRIGKFLVLKSCMSESFVRFWIRRIFTHAGGHMLDLHRRPSWNVFFISLGSLVLFKDSKTMVRFFGRRNFELFQCSAEGCASNSFWPFKNYKKIPLSKSIFCVKTQLNLSENDFLISICKYYVLESARFAGTS